jgi:hypothetical protein
MTMTKTTHTPGPWVVSSGAVETVSGVPIARMDREPSNGTMPVERDCNAYLCAASPEMLDALEDIFAQLNGLEGRQYKWIRARIEPVIKLARKNDSDAGE